MKALTWQGKRDVRVDEVPDPGIRKPDDVIARVGREDGAFKVVLQP